MQEINTLMAMNKVIVGSATKYSFLLLSATSLSISPLFLSLDLRSSASISSVLRCFIDPSLFVFLCLFIGFVCIELNCEVMYVVDFRGLRERVKWKGNMCLDVVLVGIY